MSGNPHARAKQLQRAIAERYTEEYLIKNKLSMKKTTNATF